MAATRRAILCLGSVDAMALEEDRAKLLKLQELYCRDDPPVIPARPATTAQKKRGRGGSSGSDQPKRKRVTHPSGLLGGSPKEVSTARSGGKLVGGSSDKFSPESEEWILGPSVSCLDAIKRFAFLFESPSF
jgi:hypothetical protein